MKLRIQSSPVESSRVQYPGTIYHTMNRGDRPDPIFLDDNDRHQFLQTLGEACEKTDWQPHAWCLMSNHFHLVVETPRANLVEGMRRFLGVCTNRFQPLLRNQTTMTLDWIAQRLGMGSAGHLSHPLYRKNRSPAQCPEEAT